jgi:hypothetical protein
MKKTVKMKTQTGKAFLSHINGHVNSFQKCNNNSKHAQHLLEYGHEIVK